MNKRWLGGFGASKSTVEVWSMSKKSSKTESKRESWLQRPVCLTASFLGSWLCVLWVSCAVEVLTMFIALLGRMTPSFEQLGLILCGAKAADMFICITLVAIRNCQRYGYDDKRRRGLHPLLKMLMRMARAIRPMLSPTAWRLLGIFLVALPTAVFTVATLRLERADFVAISQWFSIEQIVLMGILYLMALLDWITYLDEYKPQYPDMTFRHFVSTRDHQC